MKITSLTNEKVKRWAQLKTKKGRDEQKTFLVEGFHLVAEAHQTNNLKTLIGTATTPPPNFPGIDYIEVTSEIMKKLSFTETIPEIIGICAMSQTRQSLGSYVVVLDGVQDPGNAGMIVRSAAALGASAVVFSDDSVDLYQDKFIRATQGANFHLPLFRESLVPWLKQQKGTYHLIATMVDSTALPLKKLKIPVKWILIVGHEGQGIRPEIAQLADSKVWIPIANQIESLNVAAATTICLYEFLSR